MTLQKQIGKLQRKLDKMLQLHYVPLNPICLICVNKTSEMHHVIQKKQSTYLRYDEQNIVPLCKGCHLSHHMKGDPIIFKTILDKKGEDWWEYIKAHRGILVKRDKSYYLLLEDLKKQYD